MLELWLLVLASAVATYLWRGLGALLAGRIKINSEMFNWIACVAYAMIAGLVSRILIVPTGMLVQTALVDRLVACVLGLLAYRLSRRNLLIGVAVGASAMMAISVLRG